MQKTKEQRQHSTGSRIQLDQQDTHSYQDHIDHSLGHKIGINDLKKRNIIKYALYPQWT